MAEKINDLLDRCCNMFGGPLAPENRAAIRDYLVNPTPEGWEKISRLVVTDQGTAATLWAAWAEIDPRAVKSKPCDAPWPRIPDTFTVARCLCYATNRP